MTAKDVMRQVVEFSHVVVRAYVEDLTDAELMVRSVPGSNHIAWQLGHRYRLVIAPHLYLVSDAASFVSGAVLAVDGGGTAG